MYENDDPAWRAVGAVNAKDAASSALRARLAEAEAKPGLPPEVLQAMEDFEQDMREKTIPEIIQETKRRERLAAEARQRLMGEVGTEQALHHAWRKRAEEAEARAGRAEEAVRVLAEALVARRKFNGTKTGIEVKLNGVKCLGCGCVTFDVYGDEEPFPWEKVGHYAECPRLRVQATEKAVEQNPAARAAVEGAR